MPADRKVKFMADSQAKKESWMSSLADEIKQCVLNSTSSAKSASAAPSVVIPPPVVHNSPAKAPAVGAPAKRAQSSKEIVSRLTTAGKSFKDKEDLMRSFEQQANQHQKTVLQLEKLL